MNEEYSSIRVESLSWREHQHLQLSIIYITTQGAVLISAKTRDEPSRPHAHVRRIYRLFT